MRAFRRISEFIADHRIFTRSVYAEALLEDFFVAAVASVLTIRLLLHISGYPSLTLGGLHIAHVIAGGIAMLIAMVILLAFLNRAARELAAVIGGIGFGAFIDELGKFITSDNDYFFEPTIAIIYVAFVLLFFAIRIIARRRPLGPEECFANAFEIAGEASMTGLDSEERRLASTLLAQCAADDPATQSLKSIFSRLAPAPSKGSPFLGRLKERVDRFYAYVAATWWFSSAVVGFFAFLAITSLSGLVAMLEWSWAVGLWVGCGAVILAALFWSRRIPRARHLDVLISVAIVIVAIAMSWAIVSSLKERPLSLVEWAQFVFPSISGFIIMVGLLLVPVSRLRAYLMFQRAVLISIFFTQVFSFYQERLLALIGLIINILILLALRYMISNEEVKLKTGPQEADSGVAAGR